MLTPAEAERLIRENMVLLAKEKCRLESAHGRVLRAAVRAERDLPPFDRVMLDGYALRAGSLAAGLREYQANEMQRAGERAKELPAAAAACIEVMTGAILPRGADLVIPYEATQRKGPVMTVVNPAGEFVVGHGIHGRGSDCREGELMIGVGARLTAREIAVAAACGYAEVEVSRQPRIAVVTTGDEIVEVGGAVAEQQVRRSNDYALRAALMMAGYAEVERFHLPDEATAVESGVAKILAEWEVAVFTGGVSKGRFDLLPKELRRQGVREVFHGVAQRPGKPLWFGVIPGGRVVFGLPGNPVSAFTCLHRYVLPALESASGARPQAIAQVALGEKVIFKPPLALLLPVTLRCSAKGQLEAVPRWTNTSGDLAGLLGTDGMVELPAAEEEFATGTLIPFRAW